MTYFVLGTVLGFVLGAITVFVMLVGNVRLSIS